MVKVVGKWHGSSYTRYTIPYDTDSRIERVRRIRRKTGEVRIDSSGGREFPFKNIMGADSAVHPARGGTRLSRGGRSRSFKPFIPKPAKIVIREEE